MTPRLTIQQASQILGVDPYADAETIRRAYKAALLAAHPDTDSRGDAAKVAWVMAAYQTLAQPTQTVGGPRLEVRRQAEAAPLMTRPSYRTTVILATATVGVAVTVAVMSAPLTIVIVLTIYPALWTVYAGWHAAGRPRWGGHATRRTEKQAQPKRQPRPRIPEKPFPTGQAGPPATPPNGPADPADYELRPWRPS